MKKSDYAKMFLLRSDGRYQAKYTDDAGRHTICDRDPEKLYFKLQDKLNKVNGPVLFKDIAEAWHDAGWDNIRDGTKSSYEAPYKRAVERLGDVEAANVTARDISTHLLALKAQGFSKSTIKTQRTVYSQIFQTAIINPKFEKEVKNNPALNVKLPSGLPQPKKREAPEDEIVQAIQDKAETAYFGLFALFLICTGFRRGEALAIKWGDIDFKKKTISCTKQVTARNGVAVESPTKTDHGIREVPLLPQLEKVLVKPAGAKKTDYIFYGEDASKPMPQCTYNRRWMHYCKDMGFVVDHPETRVSAQGKVYIKHNYEPTLTAHHLRHGYATILYEAGVNVYTAQRLLGHADIETTMAVYTHLREANDSKSISKLREYANTGFGAGPG